MPTLAGSPRYRVILCRFNEIGLKSAQFRDKVEKILISHVKAVCRREDLTLQSMLHLQERLLFFFPAPQIPRAITVFRHIMGIQSISPAITIERDLPKIEARLSEFAETIVQPGDTFAVKFKAIMTLDQKHEAIQMDMGQNLLHRLNARGMGVKLRRKNPRHEFRIEMREKGAYLYCEKITTLWGGMPITKGTSMLAEWLGSPMDPIASLLLLRRGVFIIPLIFDLNGNFFPPKDPLSVDLAKFARYYAAPLPAIRIDLNEIFTWIQGKVTPEENPCPYCFFARASIAARIVDSQEAEKRLKSETYTLYPRGTAYSAGLGDLWQYSILQQMSALFISPLAGLNSSMKNGLRQLFDHHVEEYDMNSVARHESPVFESLIRTSNPIVPPPDPANLDSKTIKNDPHCPLAERCPLRQRTNRVTLNRTRTTDLILQNEANEISFQKLQQAVPPHAIQKITDSAKIDEFSGTIFQKD